MLTEDVAGASFVVIYSVAVILIQRVGQQPERRERRSHERRIRVHP